MTECRETKALAYFVLFVLSGVGEARDDGGDTWRWSDLACIDHDQQLHEIIVNFSTATLYDVHILASNALTYFHTAKDDMINISIIKIKWPTFKKKKGCDISWTYQFVLIGAVCIALAGNSQKVVRVISG